MKYYIFGNINKNEDINVSTKKAPYVTESLEDAVETFRQYVNEVRFTNCYLIADFEVYKTPVFTVATISNDLDPIMPYFIVGEWHIGHDKSDLIRTDHTILKRKGFLHEFKNNLDALREFEYCIDNYICCDLRIVYSKTQTIAGNEVERQFNRKIIDSIDIVRGAMNPIKRIKITSPSWNFIPFKERPFNTYIIPDLAIAK